MISILKLTFLAYLLLLSSALQVTHNYNYSKVQDQALVTEPLLLPVRPIPNSQSKTNVPSLLEYSQLKKYQLRDTGFRV